MIRVSVCIFGEKYWGAGSFWTIYSFFVSLIIRTIRFYQNISFLYIRKGIGTCHIFDFRLLFMVCALFWQHHPCGKVSREVHLPIFCFIDYFWLLWIGQNRPWGNKYVDTIFWITFTLVLLHFLRIWVCFTLVLWMEIFVSITHIGHRYFELTIWFGEKILCVYNYNYCAWAKILCTNFWKEM